MISPGVYPTYVNHGAGMNLPAKLDDFIGPMLVNIPYTEHMGYGMVLQYAETHEKIMGVACN